MEVWLTKLEQFVARQSTEAARKLLGEHDISLAAGSAQGGILITQGDQRRESFALFESRLQLCRLLHIPTLVVLADFDEFDEITYARALTSLRQAAQMAANHSVRLALEFNARSMFCNNLNTAVALVNELGEPNVGVCFDVFHYYTGPSKFEDLQLLSPSNLFHVQLSDLSGIPRELAVDANRILPGDGDFELRPIIDRCRDIGYQGYVSVELMNPQIYQVAPEQVIEVSVTALRRLLGLA